MNINPNTFLVFVYGSLKNGFPNNRLLTNSYFLAQTKTKENHYFMMSFGGFPGVYKTEEECGKHISGEVYEVNRDTLNRLDMLEGNGHFYTRKLISVEGFDVPVWMYMIPTTSSRHYHGRCVAISDCGKTFVWEKDKYDLIDDGELNG